MFELIIIFSFHRPHNLKFMIILILFKVCLSSYTKEKIVNRSRIKKEHFISEVKSSSADNIKRQKSQRKYEKNEGLLPYL